MMNPKEFMIRSAQRNKEGWKEDGEVHLSARKLLEQMDEQDQNQMSKKDLIKTIANLS